jgi:hypothetical protein
MVISLLVPPPEVLPLPAALADEVDDAAPWMPELQASRKAPPPTTAAPTPAARNRLRRETRPAAGWLSVLSGWAVWSDMVWISPCISTHHWQTRGYDVEIDYLELSISTVSAIPLTVGTRD